MSREERKMGIDGTKDGEVCVVCVHRIYGEGVQCVLIVCGCFKRSSYVVADFWILCSQTRSFNSGFHVGISSL